jgi:hypothetical protein
MKWILALGVVVIIALTIHWQLHTTKISYVNGLDAYAHLPNQEYILVQDCYVFAWKKPIETAYPLLGVNSTAVTARTESLPIKVSTKAISSMQDDPVVRLMDVVNRGTRFRLLSVRREESRMAGTIISYEIKFLDDVVRPYQRIDIRPILLPAANAGDPPNIDPSIAVPWIKR